MHQCMDCIRGQLLGKTNLLPPAPNGHGPAPYCVSGASSNRAAASDCCARASAAASSSFRSCDRRAIWASSAAACTVEKHTFRHGHTKQHWPRRFSLAVQKTARRLLALSRMAQWSHAVPIFLATRQVRMAAGVQAGGSHIRRGGHRHRWRPATAAGACASTPFKPHLAADGGCRGLAAGVRCSAGRGWRCTAGRGGPAQLSARCRGPCKRLPAGARFKVCRGLPGTPPEHQPQLLRVC